MKIVNAIAFAAFLAASSTTTHVDAFGPAQPLNNVVSNGGSISMRINISDHRRKSRIVGIVDANPSKETVQSELLSDYTSDQLKRCSWKVQKVLLRKIKSQAQRYELDVPEGFGIKPTPLEREAKEMEDGVKRKAAKTAAFEAAVKEEAEARAARKEKRAAKKQRAADQLASRKGGAAANGAANGAAAPAPAPAAEAPAPAAAAASGNAVTPKTIKQLRDDTGAGMMDCKKALIECDGDQEAAAEFLRKKGLAKADKKASRIAAEGKIAVANSADGKAVMVEVNCETDFVGKDSTFLSYCDKVAEAATSLDSDNVDELMTKEVDGESLETSRQALVSKIGENIQVRRMSSRGNGQTTVGGYVHMNSIGVLVELDGGNEQLCTDIAMHVTAMNPPFATADDVPADVLDNERRILSEQALESGKPPEIVEKMVEGRIRKYLEEKCLVSQNYVKDSDMTVQQLLDKNSAKMIGFTRIAVGEGIEKKEDDFAAEVAAMAGGK